jgi:hypothetical protein
MVTKWDRVNMGEIVLSTEVVRTIDPLALSFAIRRHRFGKWGNVSAVEKAINDESFSGGTFSVHETTTTLEFWIITVPGRQGKASSAILRRNELEEADTSPDEDFLPSSENDFCRELNIWRWALVRRHLHWGGDHAMDASLFGSEQ